MKYIPTIEFREEDYEETIAQHQKRYGNWAKPAG